MRHARKLSYENKIALAVVTGPSSADLGRMWWVKPERTFSGAVLSRRYVARNVNDPAGPNGAAAWLAGQRDGDVDVRGRTTDESPDLPRNHQI